MGLTVSSSIINRAGFAALMHLYHVKHISIIPSTKRIPHVVASHTSTLIATAFCFQNWFVDFE